MNHLKETVATRVLVFLRQVLSLAPLQPAHVKCKAGMIKHVKSVRFFSRAWRTPEAATPNWSVRAASIPAWKKSGFNLFRNLQTFFQTLGHPLGPRPLQDVATMPQRCPQRQPKHVLGVSTAIFGLPGPRCESSVASGLISSLPLQTSETSGIVVLRNAQIINHRAFLLRRGTHCRLCQKQERKTENGEEQNQTTEPPLLCQNP